MSKSYAEKMNMGMAFCGALLSGALFILLIAQAGNILNGQPLEFTLRWEETLGVSLSFFIDGLSLLFALLITGIGTLLFIYASAYFRSHPQGALLNIVLMIFMLAMLGLVTADNVIALFMFWELTTITSYLLIGAQHREEQARNLAWQALIVTGAGGLAFLAGLVLLGMATGTYQASAITQTSFANDPLYVPVFILLVLGCFTKSAQFPFHFWLPNAMTAPTPVSAYLHSATMVKAGIYFLARFSPALSGTDLWLWTLSVGGSVTMVWSSIMALRQSDLKLMMAYTTLMALGTTTFLLGNVGSEVGVTAALTFLLAHALYKAALFLIVGNLEKVSGSRNWTLLGGWGKAMPLTMVAAVLSCLSMAGAPPFIGFIGKELTYKGALALVAHPLFSIGATVFAAAMIAGISFFFMGFLWSGAKPLRPVKSVPLFMVLPPLLLALSGIAFGLTPQFLVEPLIHTAVTSLQPDIIEAPDLKLWHGMGTILYLSLATLTLGGLVAWRFRDIHAGVDSILHKLPITGEGVYSLIMGGILNLAARQTALLQNGRQRSYILFAFATLSVLAIGAFIQPGFLANIHWEHMAQELETVTFYHWALFAFLAASIITAVVSKSRLLAICALGAMGTGIALMFVMFSAPDVAMTQFMTEILVVIITTLVIMRLPSFTGIAHGSQMGRIRDIAISLLTGGTVTVMMLAVTSLPFDPAITSYYEEHAYQTAHGRNVVNVILVDFRALDTLGEILVVALAGLSCYALIRLKKGRILS